MNKIMMKLREFTATNLRLTLTASLFAIAVLASAGLYFANNELEKVAEDVSRKVADADASQHNLDTLQRIERQLQQDRTVVERAQSIVADSRSYQYQDQIITDLNGYAARAGITITNIDFSSNNPSGTPTEGGSTQEGPATPDGVKSTYVSITVRSPVDYNSMLRFIHSIEQNLTKMQISRIGFSRDQETGGVSTEALNIEVYIR